MLPDETLESAFADVEAFVGGVVEGEAPVGLWVTIDTIEDEDGKTPFSPLPKATRLIRWALIENATVSTQKRPLARSGSAPAPVEPLRRASTFRYDRRLAGDVLRLRIEALGDGRDGLGVGADAGAGGAAGGAARAGRGRRGLTCGAAMIRRAPRRRRQRRATRRTTRSTVSTMYTRFAQACTTANATNVKS